MGNLLQNGDQFIESDEPAENTCGKNGFTGPSSDVPGKRTTSGFLPELDIVNKVKAAQADDWQTRKVSAEPLPTAYGYRGAAAGPKIAPNNRPVTTGGREP